MVVILREEGYEAHIADTTKLQKYARPKYTYDQYGAFRPAEMLRLGILPEDKSIRTQLVSFEIYSGREIIQYDFGHR